MPKHVAIIMDGNGRWAKKRRLPRIAGHRKGVEAVRRIVRHAGEMGVAVLTLYAFSSENWRRPADEIADLMGLLRHFIGLHLDELHEAGVRIRVIGEHSAFQPDVVRLIDDALARTGGNDRMTLVIALNYGSQNELVAAARTLAAQARDGQLDPDMITAETIENALHTRDLPLFVDRLWPDFDEMAFDEAIGDYLGRERRFGGL